MLLSWSFWKEQLDHHENCFRGGLSKWMQWNDHSEYDVWHAYTVAITVNN